MLRVSLIRHGETEWNKEKKLQGYSNVLLSPKGIHQAQLLAQHLPFQDVGAIYSSDLSRAVKTAEILAEKFDLPVNQDKGFRETNFGDWEGKSISELTVNFPKAFGKFFTEPEKCHPPQGETFLQCQARAINALDKILAEHDEQNIIIVTHGAVIRLILCAALDISIHKMWAIGQFNTAVNILRFDGEDVTVELVNGAFHLYNF